MYVSPYPALSTVAPGKGVFEGADEGPAKVGGEGMRRDRWRGLQGREMRNEDRGSRMYQTRT